MYEPLKTETCKKCGKVIAELNELTRIVRYKKRKRGKMIAEGLSLS
jgi:hypothetical protein